MISTFINQPVNHDMCYQKCVRRNEPCPHCFLGAICLRFGKGRKKDMCCFFSKRAYFVIILPCLAFLDLSSCSIRTVSVDNLFHLFDGFTFQASIPWHAVQDECRWQITFTLETFFSNEFIIVSTPDARFSTFPAVFHVVNRLLVTFKPTIGSYGKWQ